ncbi:MAG: efflux RND transporter permease subunit, partial [Myxococcota bacterium]|nr:efflux RND transporter permease subunit [Myxococcota bacterium]
NSLEAGYRRVLDYSLGHRTATIMVAVGALGLAYFFGTQLKTEFFPSSDPGIFFARSSAAQGTALHETLSYLERDENWFLDQPEVVGIFSSAGQQGGYDFVPRSHTSMIFGTLAPSHERDRSVQEVVRAARESLSAVPGRDVRVFNPGDAMMGRGGAFEVDIRGNLSLIELDRISDRFVQELSEIKGLVDIDKSLKLGLPELRITPDRQKAAAMGVEPAAIAEAIRLMVGGMDVGIFKEEGRRIDIRMRLEEELRDEPDSIGSIYVRNRAGEPVALRNLVDMSYRAAPSEITRTGRQRSVTISANLQGLKLGEAIEQAEVIANEILPSYARLVVVGEAEAMKEGNEQFAWAMMLGILVIYMVLAAQFESFVHPFTVMIALPLAMVGALGGLYLFGHTLNLFSMIGIILLFGLVTKNSILLVDYANQLRGQGMEKVEAIRTAAPVRMRPVLMTALSMIFGVLPAAVGLGPGAESRAPMAVATAMGMFSSTVLTLLVVPVIYLAVDDGMDWLKRQGRKVLRKDRVESDLLATGR